jgi:hypothetical protein
MTGMTSAHRRENPRAGYEAIPSIWLGRVPPLLPLTSTDKLSHIMGVTRVVLVFRPITN